MFAIVNKICEFLKIKFYNLKIFLNKKIIKVFFKFFIKYFIHPLPYLIGGDFCKSRYLPKFIDRIKKTNNFLDDFYFTNFNFKNFSEVNLILRGKSALKNDINKSLPTFFLNSKNRDLFKGYSNHWIITADASVLKQYLDGSGKSDFIFDKKKELKVAFIATSIFFSVNFPFKKNLTSSLALENKIKKQIMDEKGIRSSNFDLMGGIKNKFGLAQFQMGSGLAAIINLLNISKKVNVYGWDQYLDKPCPNDINKQINAIFNDKYGTNGIATNLVNCIYMHRMLKENKSSLNLQGHLKSIASSDWISEKLFSIIYK